MLREMMNSLIDCEVTKSNFPSDSKIDEIKIKDYTGYVLKLEMFALRILNYTLYWILRWKTNLN